MSLPIKDETSAWLEATGEHSDIVLSSRVRLARNLKGFPFSSRIKLEEERQIRQEVLAVLEREAVVPGMQVIDLQGLRPFECSYLLEEHLVSNDLLSRKEAAAVVLGDQRRISMMINEEDHLRIQSMSSGFDLQSCWGKTLELERSIGRNLEFEFHPRFGYLTACPTNVGTGLRASVLIHLPGLVLTKEIQKVLQGLTQVGLTFRGLYGEGSEVVGNFFQFSNQMTIGKSEQELLDHLGRIVRPGHRAREERQGHPVQGRRPLYRGQGLAGLRPPAACPDDLLRGGDEPAERRAAGGGPETYQEPAGINASTRC